MWFFCGGMYRSGSTLQFQLAATIAERTGRGVRVPYRPSEEFPVVRDQWQRRSGWKVFKCHDLTDAVRAEFEGRNAHGAYIFRDVRDVMVSWMRKSGQGFRAVMDSGFLQSCLEQYEQWMQCPRLSVSRYEDIKDDIAKEVRRLSQHMQIDLSNELCTEIAKSHTLEEQQRRIREAEKSGDLDGTGGPRFTFDRHTLLHTNHIQSGAVNDWRHALTPSQIAQIERVAGPWLRANGYQLADEHCVAGPKNATRVAVSRLAGNVKAVFGRLRKAL